MEHAENNCFQDFFREEKYILLKNYLYNYILRKRAVENSLKYEKIDIILEVGSGISPVMTKTSSIIYTDLSFAAIKVLRKNHKKGWHVVADGTRLPFKANVFSHTICSEVLEHIRDDGAVIQEFARVTRPAGRLLITLPHRKFYFAIDDRFVNHYRRYEISEIENKLRANSFKPISIQKILGPLDKVTMCIVVICYSLIQKNTPQKYKAGKIQKAKIKRSMKFINFLFKWANRFYAGIAWFDARITPRVFSTVLLMNCKLGDETKKQGHK